MIHQWKLILYMEVHITREHSHNTEQSIIWYTSENAHCTWRSISRVRTRTIPNSQLYDTPVKTPTVHGGPYHAWTLTQYRAVNYMIQQWKLKLYMEVHISREHSHNTEQSIIWYTSENSYCTWRSISRVNTHTIPSSQLYDTPVKTHTVHGGSYLAWALTQYRTVNYMIHQWKLILHMEVQITSEHSQNTTA